jgi:hypothetical protein
MLDSKLFVARLDGAFRDLYERWWDGDEWVWVNHGRPGGVPVTGTPGAAMLDQKLFVIVDDGSLWERFWRSDLSTWVWTDHGRPGNVRISFGPGAVMMNEKFFVVTTDGHLWERHWRVDLGRWVWNDHGTPPGTTATSAPGAAMMDSKLFVTAANGHLYERFWTGNAWVWVDHASPPGANVVGDPGAAMLNSKLFVRGGDGHLYERFWTGSSWVWVDHGTPGNGMRTSPGAAMADRRLFMGTFDGRLFERFWDGMAWIWVDHGSPPATGVDSTPGAAMMSSKLFIAANNGHLFERFWDGTVWQWVDHGTALHDQAEHVIGAPGPDPKLTIAVLGDGYAEPDMDHYRAVVHDQVLGALSQDALAPHQSALRVIRIDVVSVESGVRERRYMADGTIKSDVFKFSRLGMIPNASWDRGWFDESPFTDARIEKLRLRFAPDADHVVVMAHSNTYGGRSSIGRGVAMFTEGGGWSVIAHELGHNLFQLGDEYFEKTDTFTGVAGAANLSETPSDWSMLKWHSLVAAGTPLPTSPVAPPNGWDRRSSVGAFEGGGGSFSKGIFRPVIECRMNSNDPPWCPVCAVKIASDLAAFE